MTTSLVTAVILLLAGAGVGSIDNSRPPVDGGVLTQLEIVVLPPHGLVTAMQRLRAAKTARAAAGLLSVPPGGIRIRLRAGRYYAASGSAPVLRLDAADSGLASAPIIFEPYGDGEVSLSAGMPIPASGFTAWRAGVLRADLATIGMNASSLGSISRRCTDQRPEGFEEGPTMLEVFFDGHAMPLARWPNLPTPAGAHGNGSWSWALASARFANATPDCLAWINHGKRCNITSMSYFGSGAGQRPTRWAAEARGWLQGYFAKDSSDEFHPITGVDARQQLLQFDSHAGIRPQSRWIAFNLLSELDQPGEWVVDHSTLSLYFMPPAPLTEKGPAVFVSAGENVVVAEGVSHVHIRNLKLLHARGTGVVFRNATGVSLSGCEVAMHGTAGLVIDGRNNTVQNCSVHSVGCAGLQLSGGSMRELSRGGNLAVGNVIQGHSRWARARSPGIFWSGVGNHYISNRILHTPDMAIYGGGNQAGIEGGCNNLFEGNTIDRAMFETTDSGAFYTCGQPDSGLPTRPGDKYPPGTGWINRGNQLIGNNFSACRPEHPQPKTPGAVIYLDGLISGYTVRGNLIHGARSGLLVHGGRDTTIVSNSFSDVDVAVVMDDGGPSGGWPHDECPKAMDRGVQFVNATAPPWNATFPQAEEASVPSKLQCRCVNTRIQHNVCGSAVGQLIVLGDLTGLCTDRSVEGRGQSSTK